MSLDITLTAMRRTPIFCRNITHNMGAMAQEAGIYQALWRPEEINCTHAEHLIPFLQRGLGLLRGDPQRFKKFNPENGWGSYDRLVEFTDAVLAACEQNPDAEIEVDR
jgi:hypothetical protein